MSRRGDYEEILRAAKRAGCTVEKTSRHVKIRTPGGAVIMASSSPSDVNAGRQLSRDLARHGVSVS